MDTKMDITNLETFQTLFTRQENLDSPFQTFVKTLAKYNFQIKAIIQDILECRDSMETLNELNEKGRGKINILREELESLELYAQETNDQQCINELESQRLQLASLLREFKNANISSMFAIEKAQRNELLKSDGDESTLRQRNKNVDRDGLLKMSTGVTEQLLFISRQLADTTQRSQNTLDSLVSSSGAVHGTQAELHNVAGTISLSSKLLKKYSRREYTDKDIEQFISNSRHGVIYVSFGSILVASSMSQDKLNKFLEAFSRIPQKVIWKWENATVPQGNSNVLFRSWLPQLDILCHPNVKAFISHGGMLSMSEAVHCGKPVLAVPFFGDQFSNAAMVTDAGLGITMGFQRINSDNLEEAIKDLLSDEKQRTAKRVSKLWHDRPQPVMDSAIYWTEYVARNKMSPPSLPGKHTSWFESTLLDVYCVLIGVLFALIAWLNITFKLCKIFMLYFVRKLVCKRKVKKQ